MSDNIPKRLHTLPVELVYEILDQLDPLTIFFSCRNVCARLNAITDTYARYQVKETRRSSLSTMRDDQLFSSDFIR